MLRWDLVIHANIFYPKKLISMKMVELKYFENVKNMYF